MIKQSNNSFLTLESPQMITQVNSFSMGDSIIQEKDHFYQDTSKILTQNLQNKEDNDSDISEKIKEDLQKLYQDDGFQIFQQLNQKGYMIKRIIQSDQAKQVILQCKNKECPNQKLLLIENPQNNQNQYDLIDAKKSLQKDKIIIQTDKKNYIFTIQYNSLLTSIINFFKKCIKIKLEESVSNISTSSAPSSTSKLNNHFKIYSIKDLIQIESCKNALDLVVSIEPKLTTRYLYRIFEFIENQAKLKFLNLNLRAQITNMYQFEELCELVFKLKKIEKLKIDLSDCCLRNLMQEQVFEYDLQKLDPKYVGKLMNLKILILKFRYSNVSSSIVQYISQILKESTNLEILHLDFSQNIFSDSSLADLAAKCPQLEKLSHLKINLQEVDSYSLLEFNEKLSIFFERISLIKSLDINLEACQLKDSQIKELQKSLEKLVKIEKLKLKLGRNRFEYFIENLIQSQWNNTLTHFDFSLQKIFYTPSYFMKLMKKLAELRRLVVVIYRFEGVGLDEEVHTLFDCFLGKSLYYLQELNLQLQQNLVNYKCLEKLFQKAQYAQCLKKITLNLRENQLTEKETDVIFNGLNNLKLIEEIDLNFQYSYLTNEQMKECEQKFRETFKERLISFKISRI